MKTDEGIKERGKAFNICKTKYKGFQKKIEEEIENNGLSQNSEVDNHTDLPNGQSSEFASLI